MKNRKTQKANLENKRLLFFEIGFILALLFVISAFSLKDYDMQIYTPVSLKDDGLATEIVPITVQKKKPIPLPPPQISNIKIVKDFVNTDETFSIDVNMDEGDVYEIYIPANEPEDDTDETIPFIIVQDMPMFPGGTSELMRYLATNIKYPPYAKEAGIQGRVFINFIVETDGSITNVKILRGIGGGCDEEAIRVVKNMPKWKPGMQRGKPVRVPFNLPVKFTLQ